MGIDIKCTAKPIEITPGPTDYNDGHGSFKKKTFNFANKHGGIKKSEV